MSLLPPGAVLLQGGIGMGFKLGTERVLLRWANMALCARDGLGGEGAQLSLLLEVPLDRTDANAEDPRGLSL
jgi:hypothetical protein